MNYRVLPEQLRSVADAAADFFRKERGVPGFRVEEEVTATLGYRPTLYTITRDHHYLCVDVHEGPYSPGLDSVVLACMQQCLPVILYVAFPSSPDIANFKASLDRARRNGVGIVEIGSAGSQVILEALPLSLAGVRPIEKQRFPAKYRDALAQAEATFRNGSSAKGCSILYDEIENLTRAIAKKTKAKGLWRILKPGVKPPKTNLDKGPWEKVLDTLLQHLDWTKCPYLKDILKRVLGITPHRNEAGHKPKNVAALIKRERELRTRFENAADILFDLITASRPLHV